jgi:heme-degrading monooxygenase HmoA
MIRRAMISRHWKGIAKPGRAEEYVHHLKTDTFPLLAGIKGFVRGSMLTRELDDGTEFQIVTVWESLDAIKAFAGANAEVAVVPHVVQELMARYDSTVAHYEVAFTFECVPPGA